MNKIFKLSLFLLASTLLSSLHADACKSLRKNTLLISGNANLKLAKKIAYYLGSDLADASIGKFNDGEVSIKICENVRGKEVYIIQPVCSTESQTINDSLMELYLLIRTLKRSSAGTITVVMPYYGYARQDRKIRSRVPISAADVAQMIEMAGADRVLSIDLHCGQIQGFFQQIPMDNLYASPVFISHFANKELHNPVVVSPDAGGVDRADQFAKQLARKGWDVGMALISKQRAGAGKIKDMQLIGDVNGCDAIIVDDLCDTGGTLIRAAELLKASGARRVFAVITHPVFSCDALAKLGASVIDEMVITDTIPLQGQVPANITVLSVDSLLGDAICRIQGGDSVSALFQ